MRRTYRIARTRGFTVAELIIAIAIILIAAALLQPVLVRVSHRAKEAKCASNLRQIHLAISLYRESYGGDGYYGEVEKMGLPPPGALYDSGYITSPRVFHCSTGIVGDMPAVYHRLYPGPAGQPPDQQIPRWPEYVQQFLDDAILHVDVNHDIGGVFIRSPYLKHKAIGLYLGGHVRTRIKQGDPRERIWWN